MAIYQDENGNFYDIPQEVLEQFAVIGELPANLSNESELNMICTDGEQESICSKMEDWEIEETTSTAFFSSINYSENQFFNFNKKTFC